MKKRVLTILLTALLFLSAVALGVSSVFRVDGVSLSVTYTTQEGKTQAEGLQERLEQLYHRESTFSVQQSKADDLVKEYPYFRVVSFKKSYPSTLKIAIVEENETYALQKGEGEYYILGDSGRIVDIRAEYAQCLLLTGVSWQGEKGELPTGEGVHTLVELCQSMDRALGGIRTNASSVAYVAGEDSHCVVTMREGVELVIYAPEKLTASKGEEAVNAYLSLSDERKTRGKITLRDADGKVFALYE